MVVLSDGLLHDVNHGRTAVDNDPFAVVLPFQAGFGQTCFTHLVAHTAGEGLGLPIRSACGNDDALKQGRQVFSVKYRDVLCLHIFERINDNALEFLNVFLSGGRSGHRVWRYR